MGGSRTFVAANNDYIDLGAMSGLHSRSAFTYSIWVYRTSSADAYGGYICARGAGSDDALELFNDGGSANNDKIFFRVGNGSSQTWGTTDDIAVVEDTWTHVAMVFDGGGADNAARLKIYTNGISRPLGFNGTTVPTSTTSNCGNVFLGKYYSTTYLHDGGLAHARIWNRALSEAEVLQLNSGSNIDFYDGAILAYAPLTDGGANPTFKDLSGNGQTGANTGTDESFDGPRVFDGGQTYGETELTTASPIYSANDTYDYCSSIGPDLLDTKVDNALVLRRADAGLVSYRDLKIAGATPTISSTAADESAPADLRIDCGTEKTMALQHVVYDDIQVSLSSAKVPASSAPTWRTHDFGIGSGIQYNVLGFAIGDYIDLYVQTSHRMKLNTVLDLHVHGTIPSDDSGKKIKWQLDVAAAGIDGAWAVPSGSPFTSEFTLTGAQAGNHNMFAIADIPAVNTTVSSIYIGRLTRIAASSDDYASEVYLLYADCHYQIDTMGSRTELGK